jgi:3-oxoacyl-[acyl-carrier protein] reductase
MLAEEGYNLVLTARSKEQLEETAAACEKNGAETLCVPADVRDENAVKAVFEKTAEKFDAVNVLINNAGMGIFKPLTETAADEWRTVIDTNLTGAFFFAREAMKKMQQAGGGTIVNVSSVVGIKGYPNQGAYTASKHGMVGLTKVIAEEGREHGIRAHVICPGGVATEMVLQARPDLVGSELIQPGDVAELVKYLINLPPNITVDLVPLRRFGSASF